MLKLKMDAYAPAIRMQEAGGVVRDDDTESVLSVQLDDNRSVIVNEYDDGEWDIWVQDKDGKLYCIAASFAVPDRHFNE
jgi:hypothetical protein